jgi:CRP/FNR family transcriptional regulator, cyclic AMP receptor protein
VAKESKRDAKGNVGPAVRALRDDPEFAERFLTYLLARDIRIQEDLVDQLFNSSEKRLARVLCCWPLWGKTANRIG